MSKPHSFALKRHLWGLKKKSVNKLFLTLRCVIIFVCKNNRSDVEKVTKNPKGAQGNLAINWVKLSRGHIQFPQNHELEPIKGDYHAQVTEKYFIHKNEVWLAQKSLRKACSSFEPQHLISMYDAWSINVTQINQFQKHCRGLKNR